MAGTIRFHLDEHCPWAVASALARRGFDATTTTAAGLLHASDEQQLAFAAQQGRVLFTFDDDFLRLHESGIEHAGIAYCPPGRRTVAQVISGLILIAEVMTAEEMRNRVEFI